MRDDYASKISRAVRVATAAQMREFDRRAAEEYGVPSVVLMENAGRHVFEAVRESLGCVRGKRVVVVAGKGNNGGDGFVAARHLLDAGADVTIYLLGDPAEIRGDAKTNLDILLKTGHKVESVTSTDGLESSLPGSHAVIDALFGTGLRGEITGPAADIIRMMNDSNRPVIAVDLPSGLDADTGRIWGVCVEADCTVTFALPKLGLLTYPGASYVGRLVTVDIGIPHRLYDELTVEMTGADLVAGRLPTRPPDAHKGTFGTALVLAGSAGMTGAAAMASNAVLRAGAGLSVLGIPPALESVMACKLTEVMPRGLRSTGDFGQGPAHFTPDMLATARELCEKAAAVVLGCGTGTNPETCKFVKEIMRYIDKPVVLDADGLNCLAGEADILKSRGGETVITPHPGEMARLLGTDSADIQSDRMGAVREAASRFRCISVLKGARTLTADPSGRVWINPTGTAGLATGGTGDVLSGAIGGLLAQGLSALDAAICGVYVHGLAGEIAAARVGCAGMIAGDVLDSLPEAISTVYQWADNR